MNNLYLYGAGGLGRELKSLVDFLPEWQVIGYFDDGLKKGSAVYELPVLGGFDDLKNVPAKSCVVMAVGSPKLKSALLARMKNLDLVFPVLKHPAALIHDARRVKVGDGSVLTAGSVLTTDIEIGRHVLVNLNCTVGHDVTIGDCSSVMPGANIAGSVRLGNNVLVGSGATILNGVCVADNAVIGAGAVVTTHVAQGQTVVGIPAKPIPR